MESREQRIATLAATLKASGIAKSDAQAKMMAEDMVGVEEHVQKSYEEKHAAAHEYLQTAKNLGVPRQKPKPESAVTSKPEGGSATRPESRSIGSRMIEPIPVKGQEKESVTKHPYIPPVDTDLNFGGKTLNQAFDHNTHNAALEAIKSQISSKSQEIMPAVASDESEPGLADDSTGYPDEDALEKHMQDEAQKDEVLIKEIDEILEAPEFPKGFVPNPIPRDSDSSKGIKEIPETGPDKNVDAVSGSEIGETAEEDLSETAPLSAQTPAPDETPEVVSEVVSDDRPKLDAQKLVELMEEDGKLEEHTREIKEKPTNVKPKEAYEENNIDLSNVFNFNKR